MCGVDYQAHHASSQRYRGQLKQLQPHQYHQWPLRPYLSKRQPASTASLVASIEPV